MKRYKKYIISIIAVLCFTSIYSFVDRQYPIYNEEIPTEEYIQCEEITNKNTISQSFYAEKENLNAISLKCYLDETIPETELTYILYDDSGKQVTTNKIQTSELKSGKFNEFVFKEIQGCKNKLYTFVVQCEQSDRSGVFFYKTQTSDSSIELRQNNSKIEGTLVMRTVVHMFDWETFVVVNFFVLYIVLFIRMLYKFFR